MSAALQFFRAVVAAALSASMIFSGPGAGSSVRLCQQATADVAVLPNAFCWCARCKCQSCCESSENQGPKPAEANLNNDAVRELAQVANAYGALPLAFELNSQLDLRTRSAISELALIAPTLLAQHTCLRA